MKGERAGSSKIWLVGILMMVLGLALAACGENGDQIADPPDASNGEDGPEDPDEPDEVQEPAAEPASLTVVTLGGLMTIHPFHQAVEKGRFEEVNLDLDVQVVGSGSDAATLFLGGRADIAVIAGVHAIRGVATGIDVKNIMTLTTDSSLDIVTRAELEIEPGDWDALRGLTCGATGPGSDTDLLLRALLEQNGVQPDRDVAFQYTGGVGGSVAAIQQGRVDCFLALPGMRAQLVLPGTVDTFFRLADSEDLADAPSITIMAQGELIRNNPDAVKRFLDAVLGEVHSIYDDLDGAKAIAYELYPALSRDAIDFELEQFVESEAFPRDGRQDPDAYRAVGELYTSADVIPDLPEFADVYDESFLE